MYIVILTVLFLSFLSMFIKLKIFNDIVSYYMNLILKTYCSNTIKNIKYQFFKEFKFMKNRFNNLFILFNKLM